MLTLTTIEKAEKFVTYLKVAQRYHDPLIDQVLDKLLAQEFRHLKQQQVALEAELNQFEQLYGWPSAEFQAKFTQGELGDDLDFVDWSGAWQIYQTIQQSLAFLPLVA